MKIKILDPGRKVTSTQNTSVSAGCCDCTICLDFAVQVMRKTS